MTTFTPPINLPEDWQQQADLYIEQDKLSLAIDLYEKAIEVDPSQHSHYWHLGLLLLLQGQEEEAQTTWLFALSEIDADQIEAATHELSQILQVEAERRAEKQEQTIAWAIRQHLREICPTNVENLLWIILLSIDLNLFTDSTFEEIGMIQQLTNPQGRIPLQLLLSVFKKLLTTSPAFPSLVKFADVAIPYLQDRVELVDIILTGLLRFGFSQRNSRFAVQFGECALKVNPNHFEILGVMASLYQNAGNYDQGVETAKRVYEGSKSLVEKVHANAIVLRGLLGDGGRWQEAVETAQHQTELLHCLVEQQPSGLHSYELARLLNSAFYLVYFHDHPQQWRSLENQVLKFAQDELQKLAAAAGKQFVHQKRDRKGQRLRIGYLSHCMATHSVGWLARWLFQHHDPAQIEVYGYFLGYREIHDPLQAWYLDAVDHARKFSAYREATYIEVADQIYQDKIDILIDLDSITLDITCQVLALKPAPVQATWLGWDASGLPAADYFIADPYVLPDNAQDYYSEKIIRLPQTYIAVDGFEVDPPTLRREDLEIPEDAIVYLSAQRGYKRHQDHVRTQMQIIKQVPNSYLLIKGLSDAESLKNFFLNIAKEEGVSSQQLRFLEGEPSCQEHRANLQIADIVLDTFPYNGATTTLETLWMEIPIVTRVGEQFAARNSYGMMMNVGVTEGIAFSDREYIEWGIRLGTDADLRQSVISKLHQAKRTAPLWNGKKFAREMESAYQTMWRTYLES